MLAQTDPSTLTEVLGGAIVVVIILQMVFAFLSKRASSEREEGLKSVLADIDRRVDELHRWHDRDDEEGVKIWYVRKSLEDAVTRLADVIDQQGGLFRELVSEMKAVRAEVKKRAP
jgi:hypothetical protein